MEGTELEGITDGVYNVSLRKPSNEDSLFREGSQKEMQFQLVDNINTFYVALTRPVKGLTVIASNPPEKITGAIVPVASTGSATEVVPPCDFTDFSQILYAYLYGYGEPSGYVKEESESKIVFSKGDIYDYSTLERKADTISELMPGYPSYPLNPSAEDDDTDVRERGRLKYSADSIDFSAMKPETRPDSMALCYTVSFQRLSHCLICPMPSGMPSMPVRLMPDRKKSIWIFLHKEPLRIRSGSHRRTRKS